MKLKKLLASILCVAMVLSTMSFTVFANDVNEVITVDAVIEITKDEIFENKTFVRAEGYTGAFFTIENGTLTLENCVVDAGGVWEIEEGKIDEMVNSAENGIAASKIITDTIALDAQCVDTDENLITVGDNGNLTLENTTIENMYSSKELSAVKVASETKNTVVLNNAIIRNIAAQGRSAALNLSSSGNDEIKFTGTTEIYNNIGTDPGAVIGVSGGSLDGANISEGIYHIGGPTLVVDSDDVKIHSNIGLDGSIMMVRRATFKLDGGNIYGNYCFKIGTNNNLAPVYIHDGTDFDMTNGKIYGNYGYFGNAIVVNDKSDVVLEGGEIGAGIESKNVAGAIAANSPVKVEKDVIVGGGVWSSPKAPITNNGTIDGNVIAFGNVENSGTITGNIQTAATVTNTETGVIEGDVKVVGTNVGFVNNGTLNGNVINDNNENVVAIVEGTSYTTLQAAIDAAKVNGDTVTLTTDLTIEAGKGGYSKAGIVQKGFDIDGNGHTLNVTGANDTWGCAIYTNGGTIKNLTIASGMRGVFTAGQTEDIILENVTIDGPIYTISADGASGVKWIIKNSTLNGWTSYTGGFEVVSFENCTFGEGAGYAYMRLYADTTYIGCDFAADYGVDARADVKMTDCSIDGTPMTAEDVVELLGGSVEANIGDVYFDSFNDALAAAVDGDTITLLADATPSLTSQRAITKASVIDLNGKTLTLTEDDLYFGTTTFKNGNIVVDPSVKASTAVFWMFTDQTLTFDNVDITATGVTGCYLIGTYDGTGTEIKLLNGTDIIIDNDTVASLTAVFGLNGTDHNVTISDSNINVNNIEGRFYLGCTNGSVNVDNSAIDLDGVKEGFYLRAGQELDIAGTSNVNVKLNDTNGRYGINLTDATANYTVADTATVNASIYRKPAANGSNLAEEVKLTFEPTDKQEVYNIYVETKDAEQTINRLSAVQVKFALDNSRMSYTLAPASELGVTLTNDIDDEEAYVFNFNGETAADATGAKLLIGTVTFGGYGDFNFTVDASFNNKIKTAQTTDNIVEEYVPNPNAANEKQGKFDIASSAITGAAVVEAKRDVKVVIDFNNDITAGNDADYNNMWVTLTGSNGEEWIGYVGSAPANDDPNDKVLYFENTAEKAEMTFNVTAGYRYTVVVKGDGYRTARYSTNVDASDDALVLTFWNNAKADENNNPVLAYIEDGEARSLKSVTFLAGDIAQDNIIDKYDLAAVVSYFGFDNLKATNPDYVKYDLNRDGKIDADDISYVLVSWGK